MKFKREIIAIILIICMLFTISAISAADSTTDAVGVTNVTVEAASEGVANDDNLATENNVESLGEGETDAGTYIALRTKINSASEGSTVYLENNYTFSDIARTSGIQIPYGMIIDGKGHSIDAQGKGRIFLTYLDGDHDVIFKNIIFLNGKIDDRGGAIYSAPDGGNGKIINCTFINNQVITGNNDEGYGGAVYVYAGISEVVNCTFINNTASKNGGAIYGGDYDSGSISSSMFIIPFS